MAETKLVPELRKLEYNERLQSHYPTMVELYTTTSTGPTLEGRQSTRHTVKSSRGQLVTFCEWTTVNSSYFQIGS